MTTRTQQSPSAEPGLLISQWYPNASVHRSRRYNFSMNKIYAYVDETGLDTKGSLFIVGVVITQNNRDNLSTILEVIEQQSAKGPIKWINSRPTARLEYLKAIFSEAAFHNCLFYQIHQNTTEYLKRTVATAAAAIEACAPADYKATILVDGLPRAHINWFGSEMRKRGISTRKVRGIRKEENDSLMRLADAICGFARAALIDQEYAKLLEEAVDNGYILSL